MNRCENVPLGQICNISIGRTPSRSQPVYWGKGYSWLSIADMKDFKYLSKTKEQVTDSAIEDCKMKLVPKGTLLFSFKLSVGKVGIADCDLYTNEAIAALKIIDKLQVEQSFLYHALKTLSFDGAGDRAVKGITLNKSKLNNLQIPLPPLAEQKRIAKILDKADALRQKNKQLLATYDELLKATFLDMFGDPVTNPKGWDVIPFSKCGRFISGGTPNKAKKKYWEGSFPWVSPKDMKVSTIYDSQDHISEIVFEETTQKKIPVDHVLIVVRGMILAHSFPVAINKVEVAINQDMKAIKPSKELDPVFLQYCLFAQRRQILEIISTAGHGTRKLDAIAIERLLITVPPVLLQNQFAQIVENIEAQKALVKQSLQQSEDLFNGLVQKAFSGHL